jgi:hypothetical protein
MLPLTQTRTDGLSPEPEHTEESMSATDGAPEPARHETDITTADPA